MPNSPVKRSDDGASSDRILINDSILFPKIQRGVARYFHHILDALIATYGERVTVYSSVMRNYGPARHITAPAGFSFRGSARVGINWLVKRVRDKQLRRIISREHPRLIYSPYYGGVYKGVPQIFTVHDMIHERFPTYFSSSDLETRRFIAEKRKCLESGTLLIAVSRNTADDIVRIYPHVAPERIRVVYHGVDEAFFAHNVQASFRCERPYFLYVGHRSRYKNFLTLIRAYSVAGLANQYDIKVVSPSGSGFERSEGELIARLGLSGHIHLVTALGERDLIEYYAGAVALVYPSEYEGFGLPILEGMAAGTVVLTSNVSSMPEVGGDVAIYFDPTSPDSIAQAMRVAARLRPEERQTIIARGIARAKMFSWRRCQEQTVAVLRSLDEISVV